MESEKRVNPSQPQPTGVQRDSETPIPQKPSFLFIVSTSLVILTIVYVVFNAYSSITQ